MDQVRQTKSLGRMSGDPPFRNMDQVVNGGKQAGVPDLTWSYASALDALLARHEATTACRRRRSSGGELGGGKGSEVGGKGVFDV